MEQIVLAHAQNKPDALAITDGPKTLTYAELVCEAYYLSNSLNETGATLPETPVAILLGAVMKQVIAQLAVRLAGGTCVPLEPSPSLPLKRMIGLIHDVGVKHIVVDVKEEGLESLSPVLAKSGLNVTYLSIGEYREKKVPISELKTRYFPDRSHVLFTSGSTGKPKPVEIRASGILHLSSRTPVTPLKNTDRVAHFNNPRFDLSLFEIWATLVAGATIVAVPRHTATDPHAFPSYMQAHGISIVVITAALFEIMAFASPEAFRSVRHVLTAGDVANGGAMRAVLESDGPPQHLWNTYGPTECTTLASMYEVTKEETQGDRVSIGQAVGDMEIFLLDGNTPIHDPGRPGEICIAGPQQCIGYLGLDVENETHFSDVKRPTLHGSSSTKGETARLYRTGDLAEWRKPGCDVLGFIGRRDNQVKHKGFRVELGEIECMPSVDRAVVVQRPPSMRNGTLVLVAFVVGDCTKEDVLALTQSRLAAYMVPDAVEFVLELPLTATGKVDRKELVQRSLRTSKEDTDI